MLIISIAIIYLISHFWRFRYKRPKNLNLSNLNPKTESQPMVKHLLYSTSMSPLSQTAKIKEKNILRRSGTRKTLFRQLETMPILLKVKKRRVGIIKTIESATIIRKSAILLETALNFQKTSASLSNLHTGKWW